MKSQTITAIILMLMTAVVLFFSIVPVCSGEEFKAPALKRLLVLYSFHEGLPWEDALDRRLRKTLASKSTFPIDLNAEHTDLVDYNDAAYINVLVDLYRHKYRKSGMNLVIGVGDEAASLLRDHGDELFPETPMLYVLTKRSTAEQDFVKPRIRVLFWGVDIPGNLELVARILPETRHLYIVAGTSITDRELLNIARRSVRQDADRFSIEYLTNISADELIRRASRLPDNSAILFLAFFRDADGKSFVPRQLLSKMSKKANAPVFGISDTYVGHGIVGGKMASAELHGERCAEIALEILEGRPTSAVAPEYMHNPLMFDWREFQRWGLEESDLPPGSIVRFRDETLWGQYRWWVIATLTFIGLQTLLITALFHHLSLRKQAEASLAQSESNLKKAQEIGRIGSMRYDIQHDEVTWSAGAREIFGVTSDSKLNYQAFMRLIHPDDRNRVNAGWQDALNEKPYDLEHRILVGATVKWVRAKFELEFDKTGQARTALGIVQDITARKQNEEEVSSFRRKLAHVSRVYTVGELSQNLAHEINQPLAAIMVNAEAGQQLLGCEPPDLAEVNMVLDDILADNRRAQAVIRRIRQLVKDTPPAFTLIDLNGMAAETAQLLTAEAISKGVAIQLDLAPDLPSVRGDPVQLQQVVLNLLVNALEALTQNQSGPKRIKVETGRESEGSVRICVVDTGPGITPEVMERLFKPFFTTKAQGLGVGLSISRSILNAHGGHLGIASNLGKGAMFCCRLPAAAAVPSPILSPTVGPDRT
jgi:PAS domain S-box-containing protein